MSCDHDVPLVAESAGERRTVGVAHAGARMSVGLAVASWVEVDPDPEVVETIPGARFLARVADVVSCVRVRSRI